MQKFLSFLFSMQLAGIFLLVLALSMAVATFVENDFGTLAAFELVYDAWWFEALLALFCINLIGAVIRKKLLQRKKYGAFLFHIAMVVILIGSGITRFFGYEGTMFIREGETSDFIYSEKAYVQLSVHEDNKTASFDHQATFSRFSSAHVDQNYTFEGNDINLELKHFIPNAARTVEEHPEGNAVLSLVISENNQQWTELIEKGENINLNSSSIGFDSDEITDILITYRNDSLFFKSILPVVTTSMMDRSKDTLKADILHKFRTGKLYSFGQTKMVLRDFYPKAKINFVSSANVQNQSGQHALIFKIDYNNQSKEVAVSGAPGMISDPAEFTMDETAFSITYGPKKIQLPFSIKLIDFQLERYPGSQSPSSYASEVVLIDNRKDVGEPHRIFMNNVLNYDGFRFFQSSYDSDEKGTVLSVNHDALGTLVTYFGYALLVTGMIISFFGKSSRFNYLIKRSGDLKKQISRITVSVIILITVLLSVTSVHAQSFNSFGFDENYINKEHAHAFGKLLIQGQDGRIKPLNTLSSEILRKVARKEKIMGMNPDQVMLGMLTEPARWQTIPMIKISHPGIQDAIGIDSEYAAFIDFFDMKQGGIFKLEQLIEKAYRKESGNRSKFENELIKTDERINILYMALYGELLRAFPIPADAEKKWLNVKNSSETIEDSTASLFVANILPMYFDSVRHAITTGNWKPASNTLGYIKTYQEKYGEELIPPESKINLEIRYNKMNIFKRLYQFYGLLGFIMLIFLFINLFNPRFKFKIPLIILIILLVIGFLFQTYGLILRWYISGHAPWSNGYESMIYIAWATMLAGFIFTRKSKIALATTAILSSLILMVAHLSWMDPQITNLVPVLKSYWLIIHVAIITASYSFLGLGALMGFLNLILMNLKSKSNYKKLNLKISELTCIIEMTLIIGVILLSIGTFLGGIWANESWGRYWGWDPKETWALITILIYAFVIHMRMMPGLRSSLGFNLAALVAYGSVMMTYFGVNYYLSGLHSYARGDPVPVPSFVYYMVGVILIIAIAGWFNNKKHERPDYR